MSINKTNTLLEVFSLRDKVSKIPNLDEEIENKLTQVMNSIDMLTKNSNMDPKNTIKSLELNREIQNYTSLTQSVLQEKSK